MRELFLDAEAFYTRAQVHEMLARTFGFPEDYDGTLDALYDQLCTCPPTRLTLRHAELLVDTLGNYGEFLLRVIAGAASENGDFLLNFE